MKTVIAQSKPQLGLKAAVVGAELLRHALNQKGEACVIVATGASQFETLDALVNQPGIDWSRVTGFHLDEYIGLPATHPASFRKYLRERFVERVPLGQFHYVNGDASDPQAECERLAKLIQGVTIDVAFVGIGENAHLAFNDPPADFKTETPYLVVELDLACRHQQLGEGWFESLEKVPSHAISMSVKQIMKSVNIVCSVPDLRKAVAVKASVEGPVSPSCPASILQQHPACQLFLDGQAASLLSESIG
jgi:glucosamine-6-phosphate deaminase